MFMVHMSLTVFFLVYRPPDSSHVYDYIGCSDYVSNVLSCLECNLNVKGPTIVVGDLTAQTSTGWIFAHPVAMLAFSYIILL